MALLTRRRVLTALGTGVAGLAALRVGLPALLRHGPPTPLEGELKDEVDKLFADVDRAKLWDTHCHLVGRGVGTGCFVSPELESRLHPFKNFQFDLYAAAAGISTSDRVPDAAYLERLLALHRLANPQGKLVLLAFDMHVDADGNEIRAKSELFTPNSYVLEVARDNPDVVPCASVHPYRKDALERLERAIDEGARAVKWLPNAMGIDLSNEKCRPFFDVLARRKVPLITHTGDEAAVDARDAQALGDPALLVHPLDRGVTVVAAHVATTGKCESSGTGSCFAVLRALMRKPEYASTLFADISACTQFNRAGPALRALLVDTELHPRLVNGSDYPLPAIDPLVSTRYLVNHELLTHDDRVLCNRVFAHNPLLFDYVLKRKVRAVKDGVEHRFPPRVFETSWLFPPVTT
jgi:mannonate dehydratase